MREEKRTQEARSKEGAGRARKRSEGSGGAKGRGKKSSGPRGARGKRRDDNARRMRWGKKEMNSMQEGSDVSNRHITWWKKAWWIRVNSGPHIRMARGGRRVWRAARRAAEQARGENGVGQAQREADLQMQQQQQQQQHQPKHPQQRGCNDRVDFLPMVTARAFYRRVLEFPGSIQALCLKWPFPHQQ